MPALQLCQLAPPIEFACDGRHASGEAPYTMHLLSMETHNLYAIASAHCSPFEDAALAVAAAAWFSPGEAAIEA